MESLADIMDLQRLQLFSVGVTFVAYACLLVVAWGVTQRGSSAGLPLKNFLSGLMLTGLAVTFSDNSTVRSPVYIQNVFGSVTHLAVCGVIVAYSPETKRREYEQLLVLAIGLYSVLVRLYFPAADTLAAWNAVHVVLLPAFDLYATWRAGSPGLAPDMLTTVLTVAGTLSLVSWALVLGMSGLPYVAATNLVGAVVVVASFCYNVFAAEKLRTL